MEVVRSSLVAVSLLAGLTYWYTTNQEPSTPAQTATVEAEQFLAEVRPE